ncbi:hypothetical protein K4L44_04075 [Halosquirtibacter laminarini]|uniref:Uncharacterized protein n=1 Tax=Halosquirtibacter laminarini TaxID=3374600 RepID=A0AC61NH75_9BACT|nr:hypothetical protein K4L44_04075 [Prolixibacteraceae bacterium]
MNKNNTFFKKYSITPFIAAIVGYKLMRFFSQGKIIDIPRGTTEGLIITIVGYLAIVITIPIVTLVIQMLITRMSKKSD